MCDKWVETIFSLETFQFKMALGRDLKGFLRKKAPHMLFIQEEGMDFEEFSKEKEINSCYIVRDSMHFRRFLRGRKQG